LVTLHNSKEPDSLICQFMKLADDFIHKKTDFITMGYHESPTDSNKVIRLSIFIAEKDYDPKSDNYAYINELKH